MPSAIWTGAVSFGLVQVPVRLVSATRSKDVRFHQLESETGARIRYRKVSDASGDEVGPDRIVKGYELSPGRHVVVEPEELDALKPKAAHTIEIEEFVDLAAIDPVYFEQPYYLAPDPKTIKPYRLLVEAMEELGKVAIGRIVLRSKERLVAIRPLDGVLCLETMRYADEVLDRDGLAPDEEVELAERELTMARQLVESLAADEWEPEKFSDQYREQVLDLIERKAAGEEIVAGPDAEEPAEVVDLVAALEASLARAEERQSASDDDEATPAKKRPRRAPAKRTRRSA